MTTIEQPYVYRQRELVEPDWTRLPGWAAVTAAQWADVQWQRAHCVKNVRQLREVMGDLLTDDFYADLERDQRERATMSMLVPPQMLNTMVPCTDEAMPSGADRAAAYTRAFYADPVRRYMLPVFSDRRTDWPSHPKAQRDSLHEHDMWAVEGLTHRYPTKVLAELLPTCPQYCGHCTRMDLVGNSTPQVTKLKFLGKPADRAECLATLAALSGREHQVLTAVALASAQRIESRVVVSRVRFRPLRAGEAEAYWATGEPCDTAGSYGIQGLAAVFVSQLEGSYSAVVGLPLCETAQLLGEFGIPCWQA